VWAEGRHEVLNEPFKQKVLDSIIDFFNKHQN
jgi:alpha-beta hydrolase superfamily lysophospholipase